MGDVRRHQLDGAAAVRAERGGVAGGGELKNCGAELETPPPLRPAAPAAAAVLGEPAFVHEAEKAAVGADVVEAVVVDAGMGDVRRHQLDGAAAARVERGGVAGGVELQNGGAELETLRPLRPAARGVAAVDGE